MRIGFFLTFAALCSTLVAAQTAPAPTTPATPSADQMIEQLRSPRTRSLRNLQVEAVQPAPSAAPNSATSTPPSAATNAATNPSASPSAPAATAVQTPAQTAATPQAPAALSASVSQAAQAGSPAPQPAPAALSLLIQFDFDSARVKPESLQALANLATALKSEDLKTARFSVEGHTDAKGRADYNQRLSQIRAEAVSSYLQSQGVASARLQSAGKGASELANRADPSAAENRRVRIVNLD